MKRLGSERKVINLCDYLLYGWEDNLSQTSLSISIFNKYTQF